LLYEDYVRFESVAASARRTLAKRAWIPDPELRVEARQFNGAGGDIQEYDTGIFFSFPWINRGKYKAAIEEAEKMQESAELDLEAIEAETLGMVRSQIERVETLHHHYTLFHDRLVPLAQQAVQASEIAYTNERGSLLELLTAQRTARETESALHDHRTEYLSAMAELQRMVGTRLEAAGIPQSKPQENP
jgi:outer membrane protein TolC